MLRTIKSSINYELKLHHKTPKIQNFPCHKNGCVPDTQNGIKENIKKDLKMEKHAQNNENNCEEEFLMAPDLL